MQVTYRPYKRVSVFFGFLLHLNELSQRQHWKISSMFNSVSPSLSVSSHISGSKWYDLSPAYRKPTLNGYDILHWGRSKHPLTFYFN
jgi:hypothetical protein